MLAKIIKEGFCFKRGASRSQKGTEGHKKKGRKAPPRLSKEEREVEVARKKAKLVILKGNLKSKIEESKEEVTGATYVGTHKDKVELRGMKREETLEREVELLEKKGAKAKRDKVSLEVKKAKRTPPSPFDGYIEYGAEVEGIDLKTYSPVPDAR